MSTVLNANYRPPFPTRRNPRNTFAAGCVIALHVLLLIVLQSGLFNKVVEVMPAEILVQLIAPPTPREPPPPPTMPKVQMQVPMAAFVPPPEVVIAYETPQNVPVVITPQISRPPAPKVAPVSTPKIEPPSSDADYLQNPKPVYPPMSKRLNEQGKVILRVLIGLDGTAQQSEIATSSGHDRLDQAALETVKKWRYVPGKRNGVAEAMWFNVPINFVLEKR
ncbi:MAG: energy transducer TonB [Betaproteobacteria bacterium]